MATNIKPDKTFITINYYTSLEVTDDPGRRTLNGGVSVSGDTAMA